MLLALLVAEPRDRLLDGQAEWRPARLNAVLVHQLGRHGVGGAPERAVVLARPRELAAEPDDGGDRLGELAHGDLGPGDVERLRDVLVAREGPQEDPGKVAAKSIWCSGRPVPKHGSLLPAAFASTHLRMSACTTGPSLTLKSPPLNCNSLNP